MNQKKVKKLRQHLRKMGVVLDQKEYTMSGGMWNKDESGNRVLISTGTVSLKSECGRSVYLKAKEIRV